MHRVCGLLGSKDKREYFIVHTETERHKGKMQMESNKSEQRILTKTQVHMDCTVLVSKQGQQNERVARRDEMRPRRVSMHSEAQAVRKWLLKHQCGCD